MPFLGRDWRSPGGCWVKSEEGWKRSQFYREVDGHGEKQVCTRLQEQLNGSKIVEDCEVVAKKRKKDHFNINTQNFYKEKWIYIHKGSTRERHGYCTLGEAFNRLDFSSAIQDMRRFNYIVKLLQLVANSQLTSLSGVAQKNYFNILEKIVRKVIEDQQNPRLIKNLLQDLASALCILIREMGRCVLVGNINIWVYRLETILNWQHQLNNLKITRRICNGVTLSDLPLHMQRSILHRFSDGLDIISLGQFCRHLILTENGCVDWKLMYFTLQKYCPKKEQYGDALQFCRHCSILFWKDYCLALLFKVFSNICVLKYHLVCICPISAGQSTS
ncbi:F-box only protein 25 isoform X3 [Hypanus sabinus]|uniref:F-box only protein 25 isoform X3 n=1 Tax=Hypanus sabinus TaxID=79690 RepID=UPI0028C4090E|nr:F-box only protein 25 isoform X3 [Hypanus sabinus]